MRLEIVNLLRPRKEPDVTVRHGFAPSSSRSLNVVSNLVARPPNLC
jgi:hypothetical protein